MSEESSAGEEPGIALPPEGVWNFGLRIANFEFREALRSQGAAGVMEPWLFQILDCRLQIDSNR